MKRTTLTIALALLVLGAVPVWAYGPPLETLDPFWYDLSLVPEVNEKAMPPGARVVDVMYFTTTETSEAIGGYNALWSHYVDQTKALNAALILSGIAHRYRMVCVVETTLSDSMGPNPLLDTIIADSNLQATRDACGADWWFVAGQTLEGRATPGGDNATIPNRLIYGDKVAPHEAGHMAGLRHNIEEDPTPGRDHGNGEMVAGYEPYAGFIDLMSYTSGCNPVGAVPLRPCIELGHYASPSIMFDDVPTGVMGESEAVAVMNDGLAAAADYRAPKSALPSSENAEVFSYKLLPDTFTTLWSVVNKSGSTQTYDVSYRDAAGNIRFVETFSLSDNATMSRNLNDIDQVYDLDEDDTPVESIGTVTIESDGPVYGDKFNLFFANRSAGGDSFAPVMYTLCSNLVWRYFNGGAFSGGSEIVLNPVSTGGALSIIAMGFDESGALLFSYPFPLTEGGVVQLTPADFSGIGTFGHVEFVIEGGFFLVNDAKLTAAAPLELSTEFGAVCLEGV